MLCCQYHHLTQASQLPSPATAGAELQGRSTCKPSTVHEVHTRTQLRANSQCYVTCLRLFGPTGSLSLKASVSSYTKFSPDICCQETWPCMTLQAAAGRAIGSCGAAQRALTEDLPAQALAGAEGWAAAMAQHREWPQEHLLASAWAAAHHPVAPRLFSKGHRWLVQTRACMSKPSWRGNSACKLGQLILTWGRREDQFHFTKSQTCKHPSRYTDTGGHRPTCSRRTDWATQTPAVGGEDEAACLPSCTQCWVGPLAAGAPFAPPSSPPSSSPCNQPFCSSWPRGMFLRGSRGREVGLFLAKISHSTEGTEPLK